MGILFRDGRLTISSAVLVMLAIAQALTSCDSDSRNAQLKNGWVTNCAGPVFTLGAQPGSSGTDTERPVFRINDQFVLAVPKSNAPFGASIDREPRECKKISDLPPAHFLSFEISGSWSAPYRSEDIPIVGGTK